MDSSTKAFVEGQNIARYADLIKSENDPAKRTILLTLLAEEKTKSLKSAT